MLMNDTPAIPCSSNTLVKTKTNFYGFYEQYFLKLYFDEKSQNIFIICYDTTKLENKRYEII